MSAELYKNKIIGDLCESLSKRDDITPDQIPKIDLYMDQVLTLFNRKYGENFRDNRDRMLTKTMINNYRKEGILSEIEGKKYNYEHIIQMIFITELKRVISISDIKQLLSPIGDSKQTDDIFRRYIDTKPKIMETVKTQAQVILSYMEGKLETADLIHMTLCLCAAAEAYTRMAETLIDEYFTPALQKKDSEKKDPSK